MFVAFFGQLDFEVIFFALFQVRRPFIVA